MKQNIIKITAFLALLAGGFSCTNDRNDFLEERYQWLELQQQEEFRPTNPGTESSSLAIDSIVTSFAVPYLVGTFVFEHLPEPNYGGPNAFSPHSWSIALFMAPGIDVTKLAPVITLVPGATITRIDTGNEHVPSKEVNYTGIAKVGVYNFRYLVAFTIIAPNGSTVEYVFTAAPIDDPCVNCP